MRVAVCIKQVPDTAMRLETSADGVSVRLEGVPREINPFDEFAIEEALGLRDRLGAEVILLTLSDEPVDDLLFHGLAMGADRAVWLRPKFPVAHPLAVAEGLAAGLREIVPDLILCGDRAVDDDAHAVGAALATLFKLPLLSGAERVEIEAAGTRAVARCLRGTAVETVSAPLPAVVTVARSHAPPRSPSLDAIFDASSKPIDVRPVASPPVRERLLRRALRSPAEERAGERVAGPAASTAAWLADCIARNAPMRE
jgi:electron transfer flavoprotein beta subunit